MENLHVSSSIKNLKTYSPAFYEDLCVKTVLGILTNTLGYNVDVGYTISLAKKFRATIYIIDTKLARKVKDVPVVNL